MNMNNRNISFLSSRSLLLTAAVSGLALGGTLWVKPAFAGTDASNLSVSATVINNCTINTSPAEFGSYMYDYDGNNATGTIDALCSASSSATITLGQGANAAPGSTDASPSRRLSNGTGGFLNYNLYQDSSATLIWGNTSGTGVVINDSGTGVTKTVYGKIPSGQNVPAGSYTDTVVATITF
jgi:spore coat protein U-like protein